MCSKERKPYPDHPERFDWWAQVLCREALNTRCYWEVEWTGLHGVDIAVSYRGITRKGDDDECSFGYNNQSWSLDCAISKYACTHDKMETEISAPVSHRVGVYLDYKAGVLSFYSISDFMTLLHRVETRFTQPLYAGFGLYQGSTVKICQPDMEVQQKSKDSKNISEYGLVWMERVCEEKYTMGSCLTFQPLVLISSLKPINTRWFCLHFCSYQVGLTFSSFL